ncbi:MAG TPA: hypothetical protein VFC21_05990, partial [Bryobacteraceae bacterium]|nr:hypothetical protein [Bryobacteraceae bacterium]
VLPARQAVAARMADRVGTFDSVLATYGVSSGGGSFRATAGGGLLSEQDSAMETLAILRQRAAEKKKREEIESRHANFGSSRDSGRGNF